LTLRNEEKRPINLQKGATTARKGRQERKRVALYTFLGFFPSTVFIYEIDFVVQPKKTKFTRVSRVEVISACLSNFVFIIGEREKKEFAPLLVFSAPCFYFPTPLS
jgi:hypothetical protein